MRKKLVVGNWKMNGNLLENKNLLKELIEKLAVNNSKHKNAAMVVCPPSVYLDQVSRICQNSPILVGAQNLANFSSGAYTGEFSAAMLKEFFVKYTIIGHSERRSIYLENDLLVATRFVQAIDSDLFPILCIGETLSERQNGLTEKVLKNQLDAVFNLANKQNLTPEQLANAIIAYEPVWAIGSGLTASTEQISQVHLFIREYLNNISSLLAEKVAILYGGSVKATNAKEIFTLENVDGGLIGGASLKAEEFMAIYQAAAN